MSGSVFVLGCDKCDGEELQVVLFPGHGVHVWCAPCDNTVVCLRPESLAQIIDAMQPTVPPVCRGLGSAGEVDGHG